MKIIPAIDLLDGQVVRLYKGDYAEKKIYNENPLKQAEIFARAGFEHIHIVDLNGAKTGNFENLSHILEIIRHTGLSVQTGGGIRTRSDAEKLLESGIAKVICSSMAVNNRNDWFQCLSLYPGQCILGMDLKNGKMAYGGWLETSNESIKDFLQPMIDSGLKEVLCTDISKDGTLKGPNLQLYKDLQSQFPALDWIASGGVASLDDIRNLADLNLSGVVIGKAYYEGRISLDNLRSGPGSKIRQTEK